MRAPAALALAAVLLVGTGFLGALVAPAVAQDARLEFRVDGEGWGSAGMGDIRAIVSSAGRELHRHFGPAGREGLEPIVVVRGRSGPITLFERNEAGEIVVRLDTQDLFWSQYAYQFAHELCHVLCRFDDDSKQNMWFEETLCELASIFVLMRMSETWITDPPYPNWRGYRRALWSYAADVVDRYERVHERDLAAYRERHAEALASDATRRDLNGAMAVALLPIFLEDPSRWEAIRWLNSTPTTEDETFEAYLKKWRDAVPERHRAVVERIAAAYGFTWSE